MYQQQSGLSGGMLKRHFTVIYGQLDDLRERMGRVESNISEMVLHMEALNRKFALLDTSRSQIAEADKMSRELGAAVQELRRDINSLRARFEAEMLSLGDPVTSRDRPVASTEVPPPPLPQQRPSAQQFDEAPLGAQPATPPPKQQRAPPPPIETPPEPESEPEIVPSQPETVQAEPEAEATPVEAPEEPKKEIPRKEEEPQPSAKTNDELTLKSLEEQLGLVPPADEQANDQPEDAKPPEKKKKRRFF